MGRGIGDGMLGYFFVFLAGDARSLFFFFSVVSGQWRGMCVLKDECFWSDCDTGWMRLAKGSCDCRFSRGTMPLTLSNPSPKKLKKKNWRRRGDLWIIGGLVSSRTVHLQPCPPRTTFPLLPTHFPPLNYPRPGTQNQVRRARFISNQNPFVFQSLSQ